MIVQLDTENADLNLTSSITALTDTPSATIPTHCVGILYLGDGVKDLDGTGGNFEIVVTIGSQTLEPSPTIRACSTATRTVLETPEFRVPANEQVVIKVKSPNGADTDVDVTAYLYDLSPQVIGTDYKALISTDAQDLSTTLDVNAKTLDTAAAATVNAQVLDVLNVDTIAEMGTGAPPASPTPFQILNFLYRYFRNKTITSSTEIAVRNNADSADLFKCTIDDDGTDFTKSEMVTG
jgi:hypothetical protein